MRYWDEQRSAAELTERDTDAGTQDDRDYFNYYYYEREDDEELPEASAFEQWWNSEAVFVIRKSGEVDEQLLRAVCGLAFAAGREV